MQQKIRKNRVAKLLRHGLRPWLLDRMDMMDRMDRVDNMTRPSYFSANRVHQVHRVHPVHSPAYNRTGSAFTPVIS